MPPPPCPACRARRPGRSGCRRSVRAAAGGGHRAWKASRPGRVPAAPAAGACAAIIRSWARSGVEGKEGGTYGPGVETHDRSRSQAARQPVAGSILVRAAHGQLPAASCQLEMRYLRMLSNAILVGLVAAVYLALLFVLLNPSVPLTIGATAPRACRRHAVLRCAHRCGHVCGLRASPARRPRSVVACVGEPADPGVEQRHRERGRGDAPVAQRARVQDGARRARRAGPHAGGGRSRHRRRPAARARPDPHVRAARPDRRRDTLRRDRAQFDCGFPCSCAARWPAATSQRRR